ncbi:MAG: LamG-like jellyroll fold domain-containing protein, partial [Methanomassiliicoccales archaeon]
MKKNYFLISIFIIGLIVFFLSTKSDNSVKLAQAADGLVAAYNFDEGSGTTLIDSSGNGNNGTISGATWTTGKYGQSLNFLSSSSQKITVAHNANLNVYPLTISSWFKTTSNDSSARGIIGKYTSGQASSGGYFLSVYQGNLRAWNFRDHDNYVYDGSLGLNGGTVNDGNWHYATLVVDATGGSLYVDGILKATMGWTGTAGTMIGTQPFCVGDFTTSLTDCNSGNFFNGSIDDVRIYNRALSQSEIQIDMNTPVGSTGTPIPTPTPTPTPSFTSTPTPSLTPTPSNTPNPSIPYSNLSNNTWVHLDDGNFGPAAGILAYSGMAVDTIHNKLVIIGGGHGDYSGNDVWTWDIANKNWQKMYEPDNFYANMNTCLANVDNINFPGMWTSTYRPITRHTYDTVDFDDRNGIVIMGGASTFIGFDGGPIFRYDAHEPYTSGCYPISPLDTWSYNLNTNSWTYRGSELASAPSSLGTSAYDSYNGQMISITSLHNLAVVWTYNPTTNLWAQKNSINAPFLSSDTTATYDSKRKVLYYFAGDYPPSNELWKYDISSETWTKIQPQGTLPLAGGGYGTAYDSVSDVLLVFGTDGLWVYDPNTNQWTRDPGSPVLKPIGRKVFGEFKFDPINNVAFYVEYGSNYKANIWAYRYKQAGSVPSDTTPPVISNITTDNITQNSSIIKWVTNEQSDSQVEFLGSCPGTTNCFTPIVSTLSTAHSININDLLPSTLYSYRVKSKDSGGNLAVSATQTFTTLSIPLNPNYTIPSLQDEKNTYLRWSWAWTADKESSSIIDPINNYVVTDPFIHSSTEGDDLWTYLQMYLRTNNPMYLNRATAWARYFKNDYVQCVGTDDTFCYDKGAFGLDHVYGWGLVDWYEYTGDATYLTAAENIATQIETLWGPSTTFSCLPASGCIMYGIRQISRQLLIITRVAEATNNQRWVTLRDRILNILMSSPYYDSQYGMYFVSRESTDDMLGVGSYNNGSRIQSPFEIGVLAEALFRAYLATDRSDIRDRIVAMARFIDQYGLDQTYQYVGYRFGIVNGQVWHASSTWDPALTTSLVNTLVLGYKYTGDINLLNKAKNFFNRGTKGVYGSATQRTAVDNVVSHFVDTKFDTSTGNFYLGNNKGE